MALESEVRQTLRWITQAFDRFAADCGWKSGEYQVLVRINQDWGRVHVILAAKEFPGGTEQEKWQKVMDYLVQKFGQDEPGRLQSISLSIRTFDEIEEGGIYSISQKFMNVHDLLADGVADGA
ncbi:MAG: hypothetical protein WKF75_17255 [Singulisphaera sp.]